MKSFGQHIAGAAFVALCALPLTGQGAGADEKLWANCRTCHAVTAPDGTQLARGGRSGPNLYGIAERPIGQDAGFSFYSTAFQAAAATGQRWTEGDFVAYLADPNQFLRDLTDNPTAEADMHVAMRQGGAALWAYLRDLSQ